MYWRSREQELEQQLFASEETVIDMSKIPVPLIQLLGLVRTPKARVTDPGQRRFFGKPDPDPY